MNKNRFVFVFKPSNKGISIPANKAKELIAEKVIIVDKTKKVFKNHGCYFLYAKDPDFNLLRKKYHILC
tara:strand:- start:350 stop:556 length:207 start_codon:yes stop_codon:yes gene_type:complete